MNSNGNKNNEIENKYQTLYKLLSPIERSGIQKCLDEVELELEKKERFYRGIKNFLIKYKNEDISSLVFIIMGELINNLRKENDLLELLEIFPETPELQFFKISNEIQKGEFDDPESILEVTRLSEEERNTIFNRLVSAPRLSKIILDLYSYVLEIRYLKAKQDFTRIESTYLKAEKIAKRALKWTEEDSISYLYELTTELMIEYTRFLLTAEDIDKTKTFFEQEFTQEIFKQNKEPFYQADILCLGGLIYYSAGQPKIGLEKMEKGIQLFSEISGRTAWKAAIYGNYGYMLTATDPKKSVEVYQKCLDLLEGSKNYQTMTTALGNIVTIYNEMNNREKARESFDQLIEILDENEELITPYRAYSVATNALIFEDFELAADFLERLEKKVDANPTLFNKGLLANAKMYYYIDGEINYQKMIQWGNEALYYFNKQKDYLNVLVTIQTLASSELQFYKITPSKRYLNNAKKRFHELLSLVGKLEMPEFVAIKNITLAGLELLAKNFAKAKELMTQIPELENNEIRLNINLMNNLIDIGKEYEEQGEPELSPKTLQGNIFETQIATNFKSYILMVVSTMEQTLLKISTLQTIPEPSEADIKLVLLMNFGGMAIYTKAFGDQQINNNLISGFIYAIDSFGKELFGTQEPYFSIRRGKNIILTEKINKQLSLALIVSKENFDALMSLHSLAKEIKEYIKGKAITFSQPIRKDTEFYHWLEHKLVDSKIT
jgi:hypothetical protein